MKIWLWELRLYLVGLLSGIFPILTSKIMFYVIMKRRLDLANPVMLNDKIMWLKLNTYKDNTLVVQCSDKVLVREYVKSVGLEQLLVPFYGAWCSAYDIKWDELPESFVMKCNHGCGYNLFFPKKKEVDVDSANRQLNKWLKTAFWRRLAEINYRKIPRLILCEKYLCDSEGKPPDDYKVYCINGSARFILVCVGRSDGKPLFYFFDENWKLARINNDSINAEENFSLPKPEPFEKMIEAANILSKAFPFVRVDFYIVDSELFFGEMTFTPSGGMDVDRLPETDEMIGKLVNLDYIGGNL